MKTNITIGDYTYGAPRIFGKSAHCFIGKFCSIGENVRIDIDGDHNTRNISTYPFNAMFSDVAGALTSHPVCQGDVRIGNDVWIGLDTIILSGTVIGDGAVIGANSVVRGEVLSYALYAGSPATFKKTRFSVDQTLRLLEMQWWNWPKERLFQPEVMAMLMGDEPDKLYEYWKGWSA